MTQDEVRQRLAAPFDPAIIDWRVGATNTEKTRGLALAYLDARAVMNRLDEVLGVFGWQSEHTVAGDRTICRLSIRDPETGEWVSRTDGAGDTDVEAEKGAFSSSLKRCAVNFGIGRYLYDIASPWVDLEQKGKSQVIPKSELARLRAMLDGARYRETERALSNEEAAAKRAAPPARPSNGAHPLKLSEIHLAVVNALDAADSPSRIDGILRNHAHDLERIRAKHSPTYDDIMRLAAERRGQLVEPPRGLTVIDPFESMTGSAPELMGEP